MLKKGRSCSGMAAQGASSGGSHVPSSHAKRVSTGCTSCASTGRRRSSNSRAILAHPVLCKGRSHEDTVDQAASSTHRLGHHHTVLLKTDNEPALVDLRRAVAERLGVQTVLESPPAHEPQANGAVENAVRQLKGLIRTLMLALQERIQGAAPVDHPAMLWLVEHAG